MIAFDGLIREMMIVVAVLALPVLIVAAVAGTIVAIVQAATQVQEQTLTLLPKILCVLLLVAAGGGAGMGLCARLFSDALHSIPAIVSGT